MNKEESLRQLENWKQNITKSLETVQSDYDKYVKLLKTCVEKERFQSIIEDLEQYTYIAICRNGYTQLLEVINEVIENFESIFNNIHDEILQVKLEHLRGIVNLINEGKLGKNRLELSILDDVQPDEPGHFENIIFGDSQPSPRDVVMNTNEIAFAIGDHSQLLLAQLSKIVKYEMIIHKSTVKSQTDYIPDDKYPQSPDRNPSIFIHFDYQKENEKSIPILLPKTMKSLLNQIKFHHRYDWKVSKLINDSNEEITNIKNICPGMTITVICEKPLSTKPIVVQTPDDKGQLTPTKIFNPSPEIYRYYHDELLPKQKAERLLQGNSEIQEQNQENETNSPMKLSKTQRNYQKENDIIYPYAMTRLIYQSTLNQGKKKDMNSTMAPRRLPRFFPGIIPSLEMYSPKKKEEIREIKPKTPKIQDEEVKASPTKLAALKMVRPIVTISDKKIEHIVTSTDSANIKDSISATVFNNLVKNSIFGDQAQLSNGSEVFEEEKENQNQIKVENDQNDKSNDELIDEQKHEEVQPSNSPENEILKENEKMPNPENEAESNNNDENDSPTMQPLTPTKQIKHKKLDSKRPKYVSTSHEDFKYLDIPTSPDPTKCLLSPTVYDLPSENEILDEGMEEEDIPEPEEENMEPLEELHEFDEEEDGYAEDEMEL